MAEALTTRYRPTYYSELLGDSAKQYVMARMSDEATYPQVWLFYGERGCGKTTNAKLLAKEYLCVSKVDGHACGKCPMCLELEERLIHGDSTSEVVGVREINVASDSGKAALEQAVKDALETPQLPLRYKILILDECHMATSAAQNMLLKVVEQPPKHLIFIFCTTDRDRMLDTLVDRCQVEVKVRKAKVEELVSRLMFICKKEKITTSVEALKNIVVKSQRNPRKAIMMLDTIASGNNKVVNMEAVRNLGEGTNTSDYFKYIDYASKGLESVVRFMNYLKSEDKDCADFIKGLPSFFMDCLTVRFAINTDEYTEEFVKSVGKVFKTYTLSEMDTAVQIVEKGVRDLGSTREVGWAETLVVTIGTRLSKLGVLSIGLQNEAAEALRETQKGNKEHIKQLKSEAATVDKTKKVESNAESLQSVFGHDILEVNTGKPVITDVKEEEPEDADTLGDSNVKEFMKMLQELG